MEAGRLEHRVTIMRRAIADEANAGVTRGDFQDVGTYWASVDQRTSKDIVNSGVDQDALILTVRVRDFSATRAITIADMFRLNGKAYRIQSVTIPDRRSGYIEFTGSSLLPTSS